ncbi:Chlorite dismutase [Xylanimonas cellulosilytica DSM 15894]|uniref:Coproheme decarboxylase n=1 Tax=Xylanimonas cellulosilytica (strain DSM 15894 / JCM 12276 / CECT 5975 / KCTC 9989 / LMG 20990 / NBRC 107835 / XIL07) TaxID=446471 RepID=D1BX69_XYLCX|nr:hydrogen peroxide-dependent heme synthase [Xylanimonas cellulosilytica]ACZ31637.1 Chlorite dismutase [Xylanimonas cellulosilytica DSM 15894]
MSDTTHVHGGTGAEVDTTPINESNRYALIATFATTQALPADIMERSALVAAAEDALWDGQASVDRDPARADGAVVVRGVYDVAGLRPDADLMIWVHGPTVESVQGAFHRLRACDLGAALEPVWSVVALHRAAEFNKGHVPAFLAGEAPRDYLCVYPFVRSYDWYLLPDDERRVMLRDHGMAAAGYKDVRANTMSTFALSDYEWLLAFEADELHRIVDLMRDLRATEARRHVREEVPFFTGPRTTLAAWAADQPLA